MNRTSIYATALVGALAAAGVAVSLVAGDADATKASASAEPTTTSTTAAAPQPDGITDGVHVVTIVAAYVAPDELVFEPAELLVGEEAAAAAEADGTDATDFYVRRHPEDRSTVPVDRTVRVTAVDCTAACEEGAPSDYATLTREVDDQGLYRLTVRDGSVVAVDAVYLP